MNDVITLNNSIFNGRVKATKRKVTNAIKKLALQEKLEIIKKSLTDQGVPFDNSITDYYDFVEHLKSSLTGTNLSIANKVIQDTNFEIDDMIDELKEGSSTAFTKVATLNNKTTPVKIGQYLAAGGFLLSAVPGVQIVAGAFLTCIAVKHLAKVNKYNLVKNKGLTLNKIIRDLEVTKDSAGNYVDTRFDEPTQAIIRQFFAENNVRFEDTGYLSLRQAIDDLDDERKEKLCRVLNQAKGNPINIDKQLKTYNKIEGKKTSFNTIKKIGFGVFGAAGIIASNSLFGGGIISALANGPIAGFAIKHITGSRILGWLAGICSTGLTLYAKYGHLLGGVGLKLLPAALPSIGTIVLAGAGIMAATVIGKQLFRAIQNKRNRTKALEDKEYIESIDNRLYGPTDAAEIEEMRTRLAGKNYQENYVIDSTCKFMDEMGITYGNRPQNFKELLQDINNLNGRDKRKVYYFLEKMDDYLKSDPKTVKQAFNSAKAKVAAAGALGLGVLNKLDVFGIGEKLKAKFGKNKTSTPATTTPSDTPAPAPETPAEEATETRTATEGEEHTEEHTEGEEHEHSEGEAHEHTDEHTEEHTEGDDHEHTERTESETETRDVRTDTTSRESTSETRETRTDTTSREAASESRETRTDTTSREAASESRDTRTDTTSRESTSESRDTRRETTSREATEESGTISERLSRLSDPDLCRVIESSGDVEIMTRSLDLMDEETYDRLRAHVDGLSEEELASTPSHALLREAFTRSEARTDSEVERLITEIDRELDEATETRVDTRGEVVTATPGERRPVVVDTHIPHDDSAPVEDESTPVVPDRTSAADSAPAREPVVYLEEPMIRIDAPEEEVRDSVLRDDIIPEAVIDGLMEDSEHGRAR